jgi:V8-like Glu-specific endopeptidase
MRSVVTGAVLALILLSASAAPADDIAIHAIGLTAEGGFEDASQVAQLEALLRESKPRHILVFAHGWNNTRSGALAAYREMVSQIESASRGQNLFPTPFRPFVIGLIWPSRAWSDDEAAAGSQGTETENLLAVYESFAPGDEPGRYHADVHRMAHLLSMPPQELTDRDVREAVELLHHYSSDPNQASLTPADKSLFDLPLKETLERVSRQEGALSIGDLFRVFTFWQMKKRAGVVGGSGGRELLRRVMAATAGSQPSQITLVGHSFGCKTVLAAVADKDRSPLPRPVDAAVLIQAAISAFAFAEEVPGADQSGGYRSALESRRVTGPVVATFTDNDWPLTWAYPLGSRLAGQTGELEALTRFAAMGAEGIVLDDTRHVRIDAMKPHNARYGFRPGKFYSVAGTEIAGHSAYLNRPVAWLLLNAVFPPAIESAGKVAAAKPNTKADIGNISPAVLQEVREANRRLAETLSAANLSESFAAAMPYRIVEPFGAPTLRRTVELPDRTDDVEVGEGRHVQLDDQNAIERIVGIGDFLPAFYLEQGAERQRAIGRITLTRSSFGLPPGTGWGTGFLVAPSLLMTNNHVIPSRSFAGRVELQMNYQNDFSGRLREIDVYEFDVSDEATFLTDEPLDYTLIRVRPKSVDVGGDEPRRSVFPGEPWGIVTLDLDAILYSVGSQRVNIVQHPRGRPKEIAIHSNLLTQLFDQMIHYQADTEPASSGSPVFNNSWDVIGLHHAGGERDSDGSWISNEAIRMDRIIEHLRENAPQAIQDELGL